MWTQDISSTESCFGGKRSKRGGAEGRRLGIEPGQSPTPGTNHQNETVCPNAKPKPKDEELLVKEK